ncbi:hypothetical protein BJY01DRAFT_237446 [Aspergillus pseudoustus]|uniref:Uncharacterized protein n=1 Tax=Aspergillus pseudoustus TaxID=1810923 RepID=A0ABR4JEV9_9EURO
MTDSTSDHFTCPSGGTWYVCENAPYFVGCCSSDPCTNVDANSTSPCPNVSPASFDTSIYDSILPNSCIDSPNANWYACNFTDPPFLGCCSSPACGNDSGCPADDLLAAAWSSSSRGQFELFQDEDTGNDDDEGSGGGGGGLSGGAIAGIVVGAVAGVVILAALIWFFLRRRKNKKAPGLGTPSVTEGEQQRMYNGEYGGYQQPYPGSPYQDSQFSSPTGTTLGVGTNPKYLSGSSVGVSLPSLSPPLPSESGRPISEMSDDTHDKRVSGQNHGLGVSGAKKPETIQELDSSAAEVHELDGGGRT